MTPAIRRLGAALALLLSVAFASHAHAQDDAGALFKRGKELFAEGDYQGAHDAYEKAYSLQKGFDIAGNLGNVEMELKKYDEAVVHLRYALANLPPSYDPSRRDAVIAKTKELIAKALQHVADVKLVIEPDGAAISIDGNEIGTTPLSERVVLPAGKHKLVAALDGYKTLDHEIDARAGSSETLRMSLTPADDSGGEPPNGDSGDQGDSADDGPSIPIIVIGGVLGLGAIGAGIGLHVAASGKANEQEDIIAQLGDSSACTGAAPPPECQQLGDLADEETTFSAAGTGLLIGGGVIVAATVVYAVWPRGGDDDTDSEAMRVLPWIGADTAGVGLSGSF